ncbi:MAG: hypothetical protein ACFE8B_15090 [Candidatus Hermodarchaeota archaeon]
MSLDLSDSVYVLSMMEKPQSYYEWQLQYNSKKKGKSIKRERNKNSLGIEDYQFEKFVEEWKKKNFPKKSQSRIISY